MNITEEIREHYRRLGRKGGATYKRMFLKLSKKERSERMKRVASFRADVQRKLKQHDIR